MSSISGGSDAVPSPSSVKSSLEHIRLVCTDAERAAIASLRGKVADTLSTASEYWRTDFILLRVLRARKLDIEAAATMYRDIIKWRREVGADDMLTAYTPPEAMRRYFPAGLHGVDLEGNGILIERTGSMDVKGLVEAVGEEEFLRWIVYYHEMQEDNTRRLSIAAGEWKYGMTVLADLANAGVRHLAPSVIATAQKRARLEEDHYPEAAKRCFVIRAPRVFAAIYNLVKPMLDEGTQEKVVVLGPDYLNTVKKYVALDQIPPMFGGTCALHGDAECTSQVCAGGPVPTSLRAGLPSSSAVIEVKSGHSDVSQLPVEPGTKITWSFKTQSSDVNFFGFFTPPHVDPASIDTRKLNAVPKDGQVVVTPARLQQGVGEYVATGEGHLTLVWDNTYSWFSSKTLVKSVDLIEPVPKDTAVVAGGDGTAQ